MSEDIQKLLEEIRQALSNVIPSAQQQIQIPGLGDIIKQIQDFFNSQFQQINTILQDVKKSLEGVKDPSGKIVQEGLLQKLDNVSNALKLAQEGIMKFIEEKRKDHENFWKSQYEQINAVLSDVKSKLDEFKAPEFKPVGGFPEDLRPLTPEDALEKANEYTASVEAALIASAVTSVASEIASAGLVESVVWAFMNMWNNLGAGAILRNRQMIYWDTVIRPLIERYYLSRCLPSLPPISDILRFMVREVFDEDIVRKYRMDENYPKEVENYTRQYGYDAFWARAYWRAHWELPSVEQGYRMFHRGKITREELETLLRTRDIMPFWRDKLIDISYELIPRVDLRYAWEIGEIGDEELERRMKALGYSDEDARIEAKIQKFRALMGETGDLERLTERRYRRGFITKEQAKAELEALGIRGPRQEARLNYYDLLAETEWKEQLLDILDDYYAKDLLTDEELEAAARQIIVREEILRLYLDRAYIKKYKKPRATLSIEIAK